MKAALRMALKTGLRHVVAGAGRVMSLALPGAGASLGPRVLCYHGVCEDPPDEWSVTPAQLRAHMALLRRDFRPVPLPELVEWLLGISPGPAAAMDRAVAVTFDDGFTDVAERAAEILAEAGVPGTAFVAPALLSGSGSAARERADASYAPTRPFMTWDQVRELHRAGWTIGSHSLTHPRLATLQEHESLRQLRCARDALEQGVGAQVTLLAYPYGTAHTVSPRDQRLAAQCGYQAAFMDMTGPLLQGADAMSLSRNKVLHGDSLAVVRASLLGELDLWRLIESRH